MKVRISRCLILLFIVQICETSPAAPSPVASSVGGFVNRPSSGAVLLTVMGSAFSLKSEKVWIGGTACEESIWNSVASITCKISSAFSLQNLGAGIVVSSGGNNLDSLTLAISTDSLVMFSSQPANAPATGATSITCFGSSPRPSLNARVGRSSCDASRWISESSLSGKSSNAITSQSCIMASVPTTVVNTVTMMITWDSALFSSMLRHNGPCTGSLPLTMLGVAISSRSSSSRIVTTLVGTTWTSHTCIRSLSPIISYINVGDPVVLSIAFQHWTLSKAYTADIQTNIFVLPAANILATAAHSITLMSRELSLSSFSQALRIGFTAFEATEWRSQTSLSAKAALSEGTRLSLAATVVANYGNGINAGSFSRSSVSNMFTLGGPTVLYTSVPNTPATGATSITVFAAHFSRIACSTPHVSARITTAMAATQWFSDSMITALSSSGKANGASIVASNPGGIYPQTLTLAFSVDGYGLGASTPSNLLSTAGQSITIVSVGFWSVTNATPKSRVARSAAEATVWTSATTTSSKYPCCGGKSLGLALSHVKSAALSSSLQAFSSNAVFSSGHLIFNGPTTGSYLMIVAGRFAMSNTVTPQMSLKGTSATATSWHSYTSLNAKTGIGLELFVDVRVTIATNPSVVETLSNAFSFNTFGLSSAVPANLPSTGSTTLTLLGTSQGCRDVSRTFRQAETTISASSWVSDSSIPSKSILVSNSIFAQLKFVSTHHPLRSTSQISFSFDVPLATSLLAVNFPATGATSVTVFGVSGPRVLFSPSPRLRLGKTSAESSLWSSCSQIVGRSCAFDQRLQPRSVLSSILLQHQSTWTNAMTLNNVQVSSAIHCNAPSTGNREVTVISINMGLALWTSSMAVGTTPTATVKWLSDSALTGKLSQTTGLPASMLSGLVLSIVPTVSITRYITYNFQVIQVPTLLGNAAISGACSIAVFGLGFGCAYGSSQKARQANSGSSASSWTSNTAILARSICAVVPVSKAPMGMTMLGNSILKTTVTAAFTSDALIATSILGTNVPPTGSNSITILASNAGFMHHSAKCRLQNTAAEATIWWTSNSCVLAKMPQSVSAMQPVFTSVFSRGSTTANLLTVDHPVPSLVVFMNLPRSGSTSITVISPFVGLLPSIKMQIGASKTQSTVWISTTMVKAKESTSLGSMLSTSITVAPKSAVSVGTLSKAVSVDFTLVISSVVRTNVPPTASVSLTLITAYFPSRDDSVNAIVGGTPAVNVFWKSSTSLNVKLPFFKKVGVSIVATSSLKIVTMDSLVSITSDNHLIFAQVRSNAAFTGSTSISILGAFFSAASRTPALRIGSSAACATEWVCDSSTRGKPTQGFEAGAFILLLTVDRIKQTSVLDIRTETTSSSSTGGLQSGTNTIVVSHLFTAVASYDAVSISHVRHQNALTTGSTSISIIGSSFMLNVYATCKSRGWQTAAAASTWGSNSAVTSKVSSVGAKSGLPTVASVAISLCSLTASFSYNLPSSSGILRSNGPRTGSASITILGSNAATVYYSPKCRVQSTASEATQWVSASATLGRLSALWTTAATVSMTSGLQFSSISLAFSLNLPSPIKISRVNGVASGSNSVTLLASGFSRSGRTVAGLVGKTSIAGTKWLSETSFAALTPSQQRGSKLNIVGTASGIATLSQAFTQDAARPSAVSSFNLPATAAVSATVNGFLFHDLDSSYSVRLGTSAESSMWVSTSSLYLKAASGAVPSRSQLTATINVATITSSTSFDTPVIISVTPTNIVNTGASSISILGTNFRGCGYSLHTRLGNSASTSTQWTSDSGVKSKPSPGTTSCIAAAITVFKSFGSITLAFSHSLPQPSSVSRTNAPPSSSISITILGRMFMHGADVTYRIGLLATSAETTRWRSSTSLFAKLVSRGVAGRAFKSIMVSSFSSNVRVSSSLTMLYSHDSCQSSAVLMSNTPATGSTTLTLLGTAMRTSRSSESSRILSSSSLANAWTSISSISCKVMHGTMAKLSIVASVESMMAPSGTVSLGCSFDNPLVAALGWSSKPCTGSTTLTIVGSDFGIAAMSAIHRMVPTSTEASLWTSASTTVCKMPSGSGSLVAVAVTISTKKGGTDSRAFTFELPIASAVQTANIATTASTSLTMLGRHLGRSPNPSAKLRIGGSGGEATGWTSDSSLRAKGIRMFAVSRMVAATSSTLQGTHTMLVTMDVIGLSSFVRSNVGSTGAFSITVISCFAALPVSQKSRASATSNLATTWLSDSALVSKTSATSKAAIRISATSALRFSSCSRLASFDAPLGASFVRSNGATTGAVMLTLLGSEVAASSHASNGIGVFKTAAETSLWRSSTCILGKSISGTSLKCGIQVTSGSNFMGTTTQVLTLDGVAAFPSPTASNYASTASNSVTIVAANMDRSSGARLGRTSAVARYWFQASSVQCKTAAGVGRNLGIAASSVLQRASLTLSTSYNLQVSSSVASNQPGTGGASVTVIGLGLCSSCSTSSSLRVGGSTRGKAEGGTATAAVLWVSDSCLVGLSVRSVRLGGSVAISAANNVPWSATQCITYCKSQMTNFLRSNVPLTASCSVTIFGSFVATAGSASSHFRMAASSSEATKWCASSSVSAKVALSQTPTIPGATITVVVEPRSSMSSIHTFDTISVQQLGRPNSAGTGAVSVTILGTGFISSDISPNARAGKSNPETGVWVSQSSIRMKTTSAVGVLSICATIQHKANSKAALLTCDLGGSQATTVRLKTNVPTSGAVLLTFVTKGLGNNQISVGARMAASNTEHSSWYSDTAVVVRAVLGLSRCSGCPLHITVKTAVSSRILHVTYDAPIKLGHEAAVLIQSKCNDNGYCTPFPEVYFWTIKQVDINLPVTGAVGVTLMGSLFGLVDVTSSGNLGGSFAEMLSWLSDTVLRTKCASGFYPRRGETITVLGRKDTTTDMLSYNRIIATTSSARNYTSNAAATGSLMLTLVGTVMGRHELSMDARIGPSTATASPWQSSTTILSKTAGAIHATMGFVISLATLTSVSRSISMDLPVVRATIQPNGPATGATFVTFSGANFGRSDPTVAARVGNSTCDATTWKSDSAVICRIPIVRMKEGYAMDIVVSIPSFMQTSRAVFAYDLPSNLTFTVTGDVMLWDRQKFILGIATFLQIDPDQIEILAVVAGSFTVLLRIRNPSWVSLTHKMLDDLSDLQNSYLGRQLGVTNIEVQATGDTQYRPADKKIDPNLANAVEEAAKAAVGVSVGGATGSSVGSSASGSAAGSGAGAMGLIDEVQFIAITTLLGSNETVSAEYKDFSAGFAWANFHLVPWKAADTVDTGANATAADANVNGTSANTTAARFFSHQQHAIRRLLSAVEEDCVDGPELFDLVIGTLVSCSVALIVVFIARSIVCFLVKTFTIYMQAQKLRKYYLNEKREGERPKVEKYLSPGLLLFPRWELTVIIAQYMGLCDAGGRAVGSVCSTWLAVGVVVMIALPGAFFVTAAVVVWKKLHRQELGEYVPFPRFNPKVFWEEFKEAKSEEKGLKGFIFTGFGKLKVLLENWRRLRYGGDWEERKIRACFSTKVEPFVGDYHNRSYFFFASDMIRKFLMGLFIGLGTTGKFAAYGVCILFGLDFLLLWILRPYRDRVKTVMEMASSIARLACLLALVLSITGIFERAFTGFMMFMSNLAATLLNFFNTIFSFLGIISTIMQVVINGIKMVKEAVAGAFSGWAEALGQIKDSIDEVVDQLDDVIDADVIDAAVEDMVDVGIEGGEESKLETDLGGEGVFNHHIAEYALAATVMNSGSHAQHSPPQQNGTQHDSEVSQHRGFYRVTPMEEQEILQSPKATFVHFQEDPQFTSPEPLAVQPPYTIIEPFPMSIQTQRAELELFAAQLLETERKLAGINEPTINDFSGYSPNFEASNGTFQHDMDVHDYSSIPLTQNMMSFGVEAPLPPFNYGDVAMDTSRRVLVTLDPPPQYRDVQQSRSQLGSREWSEKGRLELEGKFSPGRLQ